MIPEHVLSLSVIQALYLSPDNQEISPIVDYELGGIALNDSSQGLQVQVWTCRLVRNGVTETSAITLEAPTVPAAPFFTGNDFTEVSFTFDQNMNPFFAYVENGQAKFYWFDTVTSAYTVTELPVGSRSPKCCHDDKRDLETSVSDIILTYMRGDTLYYREQRDRYLIEYTLATGHTGLDVLVVGMNKRNRLQWVLGTQDYPTAITNYRIAVDSRRRKTVGGDARRLVRQSYG